MDSTNSTNPMGGGGAEANDGGGASRTVIEVKKPTGSDAVTINVRIANGRTFSVQVSLESSVESYKSVIAQNCDIPAEQQRLIYNGRLLMDDQTLNSYGLEAEHTVQLVRRFPSNNTANAVEGGTMDGSRGPLQIRLINAFPEAEVLRRIIQNRYITQATMYRLMAKEEALLNRITNNSPQISEDITRDPDLAPLIYGLRVLIIPRVLHQVIEYLSRRAVVSDPRNMNLMTGTTSQSSNPQLTEMAQNPSQLITSPEAMQRPSSSQPEQQQSTRDAGQMDEGKEQVYASQLAQLEEWGFYNGGRNLEALIATAGNVGDAFYRLIGLD